MWTYPAVKAAAAALSPSIDDADAAAVALNAQTVTLPAQFVSVAAIHGILLLSGDWLAVQALSAAAYSSGFPSNPSPQDQAISAAKLAVQLAESKVETIDADKWPNVQAFLGGLHQADAVSDGTLSQINALAQPVVPVWEPALTGHDVTAARTLY